MTTPDHRFIAGDREFFLFYHTFIPELGQHLQHVDADLLRIIIQPCTDDTETVRRQNAAMQLVGLVLLVLLIFFIRYLFLYSISVSFWPPINSASCDFASSRQT